MTPTNRTQAPATPAGKHDRRVEYEIIIEILRDADGCLARSELERRLAHIDPLALGDALERLQQRKVVRLDGEMIKGRTVARRREKVDMLAAVVVHVLVTAHPRVLSVEEVARECERDPAKPREREEVELALRWILIDELACRREAGWAATRPAVRAAELSF